MAGFFRSLFGKQEAPDARVPASAGAVAETATPVSAAQPLHVTDESFKELVLDAPLPVLVDFWAPWCGPCRMVAPIVEDLARDYDGRAVVAKINTDESARVAGELGIMGIPTLILFKAGQEADRIVGFAPRKELEARLKAVVG